MTSLTVVLSSALAAVPAVVAAEVGLVVALYVDLRDRPVVSVVLAEAFVVISLLALRGCTVASVELMVDLPDNEKGPAKAAELSASEHTHKSNTKPCFFISILPNPQ